MEERWTVYCHTHQGSGRRYIGLTKLTMMRRWNQHIQNASKKRGKGCRHFWNAIRAYGKDAFSHEVLETCSTVEEANTAEEKWIIHFDTRNPEKGFNLIKGGGHVPHPVRNPWDRPEYRAKMGGVSKAVWQGLEFRSRHAEAMAPLYSSPDYVAKMSSIAAERARTPEGRAQRIAAAKPGKVLTEEHRAKIRASSRNSDPQVKARISEATRLGMQDSEVRRKISESARKTHCKRGHSMDEAAVHGGRRVCVACRHARKAERFS